MTLSKREQRVLHALAHGGELRHLRGPNGKIQRVQCVNREGHALADGTLAVFERLRRLRFVRSSGGRPYRITSKGLSAVRARPDNR